MSRSLLIALALVAVLASVPTVAAQDVQNPLDGHHSPTPTEATSGAALDGDTTLISSSYNGGEVKVRISSDVDQTIVVQDLGTVAQLMDGGATARASTIPRRSVDVEAHETVTIAVQATEYRGTVAVAIQAGDTVHFEKVRTGSSLFRGQPSWSDVRVSALGGASGGLGIAIALAYRKRKRESAESRRIL